MLHPPGRLRPCPRLFFCGGGSRAATIALEKEEKSVTRLSLADISGVKAAELRKNKDKKSL